MASGDVADNAPEPGCDRIIFPVSKSSPLNQSKRAFPEAHTADVTMMVRAGIPDSTTELLDADCTIMGATGCIT
jgi:hypothetical protein